MHDRHRNFGNFGNIVENNENLFFRHKSYKYQNFTGFWFIKEGKDVSNIYYKIQDHTCPQFFKILILNIGGLHQPPPYLKC